jgi:hypothetical protein
MLTSHCLRASSGRDPNGEKKVSYTKAKKKLTSKEQVHYNTHAPFVWLYKANWIFKYPL